MAIALNVSVEDETDYPTTYESGLDQTIEELRLQNERECAQYKMELEYRYKDKVSNSVQDNRNDTTSKLLSNNTTVDDTVPAGRTVQHNYEPLSRHSIYTYICLCVILLRPLHRFASSAVVAGASGGEGCSQC